MRFPSLTGRKQAPDRADEILARLEALERQVKTIDVEWSDWYDKYRRLYARLAKRVERSQTDELESPRGEDAPPPSPAVTNPLALAILRGARAS